MHWQSEKDYSISHLQKSFDTNIANMYKLYLYYLSFLQEMWHFGSTQDAAQRSKTIGENASDFQLKLFRSPLLSELFNSNELNKELEKYTIGWTSEEERDLIKKLFNELKASERYSDFVQFFNDEEQHVDFALHILKQNSENNSLFEQHIEEQFSNVHDDYKLVFAMVKKTLMKVLKKEDSYLVTLVQDEENTINFGRELIKMVVEKDAEIEPIVAAKITKWEPGQIAVTDRIILKMGIAEFKYFPSIHNTVTINEYVEISKLYSPPKSKKFVNGLLDAASKEFSKPSSQQ
ncbi:MAG: transcription antitermination protein NusB [Bacteroidetes bacterium]|nr:transcription antitermination protein NusB [Bacteroidota bacterium]